VFCGKFKIEITLEIYKLSVQCMASFDCWYCRIAHPRPVGHNCVLYKTSMETAAATQSQGEGHRQEEQVNVLLVSQVGPQPPNIPPVTSVATEKVPVSTAPEIPLPTHRALNSTPREDSI
jgi:hypothetical protein